MLDCSLNKLLNLNWGGMGPLAVHALLQLIIFMTKQKSPRNIFEWIILFTAKTLQETMYLTSPYLGHIPFKI